MKKTLTESEFMRKMIFNLIKLPFILIMILIGKKKIKDALIIIKDIKDFFLETKFVTYIALTNIIIFLSVSILLGLNIINENFLSNFFLSKPSDLFSLNFIPIICSWFMHADTTHLFGNIFFLFFVGRIVERKLGTKKTALIYFGSAIVSYTINSIIYSFIINNNTPGLGASGAIAGLISVAMLIDPIYIVHIGLPIPVFILGWIFLSSDIAGIISPTVGDNIGHITHLSGFFTVTILFFLLDIKDKKQLKKGLIFNIVSFCIFFIIKTLFF